MRLVRQGQTRWALGRRQGRTEEEMLGERWNEVELKSDDHWESWWEQQLIADDGTGEVVYAARGYKVYPTRGGTNTGDGTTEEERRGKLRTKVNDGRGRLRRRWSEGRIDQSVHSRRRGRGRRWRERAGVPY